MTKRNLVWKFLAPRGPWKGLTLILRRKKSNFLKSMQRKWLIHTVTDIICHPTTPTVRSHLKTSSRFASWFSHCTTGFPTHLPLLYTYNSRHKKTTHLVETTETPLAKSFMHLIAQTAATTRVICSQFTVYLSFYLFHHSNYAMFVHGATAT